MRLITKLAARSFAVEPPVDSYPVAIHPAVPRVRFALQRLQIGDASFADALTGEQTDFDLGLMEPASMRGCVMDRETVPNPVAGSFARSSPSGICGGEC